METWLLLAAYKTSPAPYPMALSPTPTTHRLATIPHYWYTIVRWFHDTSSRDS